MDDLAAVLAFYAERDERRRLAGREGWIEGQRVRRLLGPRLPPPPARVLDVGGGPGVHARWLADAGHDVRLVDLVEEHVTTARGAGIDAALGDARDLRDVPDASVDVLLLLGPLYHLVRAADRARCLDEVRRVLHPDGWTAVTAVTRVGLALHQLRTGADADPSVAGPVARVLEHGHDPEEEDPVFHCHRVDELCDELTTAGLVVDRVHGIEGPGWPLLDLDAMAGDPRSARVLALAEALDDDPTVTGASAHLLAFARPDVDVRG